MMLSPCDFDIAPISETKRLFAVQSRLVDQVKNEGLPAVFEKSRSAIQGFLDISYKLLIRAPTMLRAFPFILHCFSSMFRPFRMFARDVRQAYAQAETKLARTIYIHPPRTLKNSLTHVVHLSCVVHFPGFVKAALFGSKLRTMVT